MFKKLIRLALEPGLLLIVGPQRIDRGLRASAWGSYLPSGAARGHGGAWDDPA